jgi:Protein of unknown function (DUF1488)
MALGRGAIIGFDHDRMVMLFSMLDGDKEVRCAVSSSAMDDLERGVKAKPDARDTQFLRLRDRIDNVPRAISSPGNSRARHRELSCAAWIFGPSYWRQRVSLRRLCSPSLIESSMAEA